ncbi:MAG: serine/threonine protein kinase [Planctomycetales bacterium]|nr:serine/threonine protein kinase [Planctomycetales bacterium]
MAVPTGAAGVPRPTPGAAEPRAIDALERVGKYELQKKIGAGGMGAVYLAVDSTLKRTVALKILPHDKAQNPTLVKRFHAEAHAAAQLKHDNIVTVYEAGEADGYNYIALEFIDGIDVAELVERRGVIPARRATDIIKQVAKALQHAQEAGIVHRDIKPANLMIRRDGMVKLTDMGLARVMDETAESNITRAGTTVGTVDYMSPEQAQNSKSADTRSDIYSLGCTWYHMVTGQAPFPEGSITNKLQAHAIKPPPDPRDVNSKVPEATVAVMQRMMAKKPQDRYQTPAELIADLERSHISRESVAESIMAGLADEEDSPEPLSRASSSRTSASPASTGPREEEEEYEEEEAAATRGSPSSRTRTGTKSGTRTESGSSKQRTVRTTPPRDDVLKGPIHGEEQDYTKVLYAAAGLVVIAVIAGLVWLFTGYSGIESQPIVIPLNNQSGNTDKKSEDARAITSTTTDPNTQQITTQDRTQPGDNTITPQTAKTISDNLITKTKDRSPGTTEIKSTGSGQGVLIGSGGTSVGVRELRYQKDFPAWVGEQRQPRILSKLVVNPGVSGQNVHQTLASALDAAPVTGAEIELIGAGPFTLRPVTISGKSRVVIRGQGNARPLIVLLPPRRAADVSAALHCTNGNLELFGVDLALDASTFNSSHRIAAVRVTNGSLYFEDCSLAVVGLSKSDFVALQLDDPPNQPDPPTSGGHRLLVSRSSIRGPSLTGLLCQTASLDAVVRDSLFITRDAPVVQFDQSATANESDERRLLVAFSTLISRSRAVVFSTRDTGQHIRTDVKLLNTLVAAEPGAAEPTLLTIDGWSRADASSLLANYIEWKSNGSAYLGWKRLAWIQPDGVVAAASPADWTKRWKDGGDPEKFLSDSWPASPLDDLVKLDLDALRPDSVGVGSVKSSTQGWPGCSLDGLRFGDLSLVAAAIDHSARPDLPTSLLQTPPAAKLIRVDVTREDLGKFIAKQKLDDNTIIVATGFGAQTTSPIIVQGNRLRLRFEQDPEHPLMLMPKLAAGSKDTAMFSVSNGALELENAILLTFPPDKPAPEKLTAPTWFIQAGDSDVVLRRCRVQAPLVPSSGSRGIIRWTRSEGAAPARSPNTDIDNHIAIFDSFLLGMGTLLDIDIRHRGVFVRNSVLASRDTVFALNLGSQDADISGTLDMDSTTLAAGESVFRVQGASLAGPASNPLSCFVEHCVFGPSIRSGAGKPPPVTLLVHQGPVLEQRQLAWWERGNAYATDLAYFVQAAGGEKPAAAQAIGPAWQSIWGADRIQRPLTGDNAVKLDGELPTNRGKLEPVDFQLSTKCKAFAWRDGQSPVGVDVFAMKLPDLFSDAGTSKPGKKPKPTPPVKPKPGF